MTVFAVQYIYDEQARRRDKVRPEHRAFLSTLLDQGTLLASGPLADDGAPGALLIMAAASAREVDLLLDADPFKLEGLIIARVVREWTPVFGPWTSY
jgi:uncharacterized protein YciI